MSSTVKVFEELIVETASLILAVNEFEVLEGENNAAVRGGLEVDRDIAILQLLDLVSTNPLLRILVLARRADRFAGADLTDMSKEDFLKALIGSSPEG